MKHTRRKREIQSDAHRVEERDRTITNRRETLETVVDYLRKNPGPQPTSKVAAELGMTINQVAYLPRYYPSTILHGGKIRRVFHIELHPHLRGSP